MDTENNDQMKQETHTLDTEEEQTKNIEVNQALSNKKVLKNDVEKKKSLETEA